jgi:hypothetical protein
MGAERRSGRRSVRTIAFGLFALTSLAGAPNAASDRAQVEAVVREAYVQGVHANPDPEAMRRGFHPDFRMLVLREGQLRGVTLDEWAARVERAAAERRAGTAGPEIRADLTQIDVTGDAATVRLELHRDGKHVYTDYLSLYRLPEGWRIVSKTFQAH